MGKNTWLAPLLALSACAAPLSGVRVKGAEILACRADALAVEYKGGFDYLAQGCGHAIWLRCLSEHEASSCRAAPVPTAVVYDESLALYGLAPVHSPPSNPYHYQAPIVNRAPMLYMPGQYNPNTGTIQHDYAHQFTRPYTPPPPMYHQPPVYTPPSYHHY